MRIHSLLMLCFSLVSVWSTAGIPTELASKIQHTMETFQVPGVAVAVVKDGETLFAKGFGVRELGKSERVDADTLFGIASNSKAFTGASLAMLVDEGLIRWDDKVVEHLPGFRLYDPYITAELTIEDLLVHRSGFSLGAGDLLHWPKTQYSAEEIVHRLRFIKPATSFRSGYAYDNVLYLVAGQVVEAVSGKPWTDFVRERIFAPLGMTRSNFSDKDFLADPNHVSPHAVIEEKLQVVPLMGLDNIAPAGAINASVNEMVPWLKAQLAKGEIAGTDKRLFSEGQSRAMHTMVTPMPVSEPPPSLAAGRSNFRGYGLGWVIQDYRGKKMVSHNGGLLGQVSRVALLPELNLGVVVLTNQQSGATFMSIANTILDHYLQVGEPTDWTSAYHELISNRKEAVKKRLAERDAERAADSTPSLALAGYAGTFRDAWYGDIAIKEKDGKLEMSFLKSPLLTGAMEHYQHDTFIVRWYERSLEADAFVTFALEPDGSIERMKMRAVSPLTDFSFNFQDLLFHPVEEE